MSKENEFLFSDVLQTQSKINGQDTLDFIFLFCFSIFFFNMGLFISAHEAKDILRISNRLVVYKCGVGIL